MTGKAIPAGVRRVVPQVPALGIVIVAAPMRHTGQVRIELVGLSPSTHPTVKAARPA